MVYTLTDLVLRIRDQNVGNQIFNNPLAQLGPSGGSYLGSTLLPERVRRDTTNSYTEMDVRFMGMPPAIDNSRYTPPQMIDSGFLMSSVSVNYGHTDTASQLRPDEVDQLNHYLNSVEPNTSVGEGNDHAMDSSLAMATALKWIYNTTVAPHMDKNEAQRWQALVKGLVPRRGNNNYKEDVAYYRPPTHQITVPSGTTAAPTGWFDTTGNVDPLDTFFQVQDIFEGLGYNISQIITDRAIARTLSRNKSIIKHGVGTKVVLQNGGLTVQEPIDRSVSMESLGGVLAEHDFPNLTIYKKGHTIYDPTSQLMKTRRFLDFNDGNHYMLFVASTDRETDILLPEDEPLTLPNTLGYYGVGTVATYGTAGKQMNFVVPDKFPVIPYVESMAEGFPVVQNPDALVVVTIPKLTN